MAVIIDIAMGAVAVQELAYAAEQSGADMATLETGVRKMQRAIVEAGQGRQGPDRRPGHAGPLRPRNWPANRPTSNLP